MNIDCSIIIPTFNRPGSVENLVDALLHQLWDSTEIIVVSQGALVPNLPQDPRITHVHLGSPSLTKARNEGVAQARGEILLFLDDDCIPSEDLIREHIGLHTAFPHHGAIAGSVHDHNNKGTKTQVVRFDTRTLTYDCDYAKADECDIAGFPGGHVSFKRKLFERFLYDPWFRGNAQFEEIDFAMRLMAAGIPIRYSSRVAIDHFLHETGGCRSERTTPVFEMNRFFNRGLCFAKNVTLRHVLAFVHKQKYNLEYLSRKKNGHSSGILLAGGIGLLWGMGAGFVRRTWGDARFRPVHRKQEL